MPRHLKLFLFTIIAALIISSGSVLAKSDTSVADEIEIGRKSARITEMMYPVSENQVLQDEIDKLGKSLVPYVTRKDIPYKFRVIEEQTDGRNDADAFSYSGGRVYISERLWRLVTPSERIALVAHEIAHVDLGHGVKMARKEEKNGTWGKVLLDNPNANFGSWGMWQMAAVGAYLRTMQYSRDQEKEADLFSIELMRQAGLSPAGSVTAMKKLRYIMDEPATSDDKLKSTHPDPKVRTDYLTKRCIEVGIKPEDLELPNLSGIEQPGRIGSVKEVKPKKSVLIDTKCDLKPGDYVWVKKTLWDDQENKLVPTPIAFGRVAESGQPSKIGLTLVPPFDIEDVMTGDQVYPMDPIDQKGSLGMVKSFKEQALGMMVTTEGVMPLGQLVWIKQPQWDEASKTVKPRPVAYGAFVSNGRETTILTRPLPGCSNEQVDSSCSVYYCRTGDDRARLGSMVAKWEDPPRIVASTDVDLVKDDEVWVERMDWDQSTNQLVARPIASGIVTEGGSHPEIRFLHIRKIEFEEIDDSCGIYLRTKGELRNRLGKVASIDEKKCTITVTTDRKDLPDDQPIFVQKMIWNTPTHSIVIQTIARGVLINQKGKATFSITPEPECGISDIDKDDEVYLPG